MKVLRPAVLPFFALVLAVAALLAAPAAEVRTDWTLEIRPLDSPAAAASGQPQLSVSSRGVILSWIERAGARAELKFAERTPAGWSEARTAASGDGWFVNWADVPSVVRMADGTLAAHWFQKSGPGTYAYDVRLSFSKDDGRTWTAPATPHSDGTQTEHGFASVFQMPGAGLGLVWLDGRAMTGGHGSGGDMSLRAAVFGTDLKQQSEVLVDNRVCECCPTTAALTSEGAIVAYRNRSAEEVRDIYIARLENGAWTEGTPVHEDNWRIPACPVNGPVLSARGRDVAIAWFTIKNDQGQVFAAFSTDAGRTFGTPVRLDEGGSLGRVDIELLPDGSAAATYIESGTQPPQFRVRRVEASGRASAPLTVAGIEGNRTSGYPRLALHDGELTFAWIERDKDLQVKTASARLPRGTPR